MCLMNLNLANYKTAFPLVPKMTNPELALFQGDMPSPNFFTPCFRRIG